jgi:hypothetical protein
VADYEMYLSLIFYDGFVLVKDFEFSDVCLMKANGGCSVLACQSLACPIILYLYSVLSRRPLDPLSANEMAVVCGLGFVRVVDRVRG